MDQSIDVQSVEQLPEYFSDSSNIESISQAKLDELGVKCMERLRELRTERENSQWDKDKEDDFNAYHLIPPAKTLPYKGYPNLACPLPRIGIDTFHANVLFTFGGQQGKFNVLPDLLSKSHMDSAERAAKYMTYVLNYESDMYAELDKADLDAQKYGVGYLKATYETREAWETRVVTTEDVVPKINELTGEVTRDTVKRKKKERVKRTLFDGVKVRRLHPESIFASAFIEDVKDAIDQDYLFEVTQFNHRRIEELSLANKDQKPFFSPSQVKKLKHRTASEIISRLERNKQKYDGFMVDRLVDKAPLELAEAHFRHDVNDDGLAEKITLVFEVETGIVLRATYGECRIVKLNPRPVDGRWYGESVRKAIQPLKLEWEAIHNQRVAKGQWANLPFFFYRAGGRFNPQTITLSPGKGYPVDNPQDVQFPQFPSTDLSYFNEEKLIMDLIDRVLALGDVMQGVTGRQDATATETIHSQQRAGIRLATPLNRIAGALNELIAHMWELNKQCAPEIKEFKIVGMGNGAPIFDKITSADYESMVSFKLNMATMYDVQMARDTALLNYKTFIANPLFMNNPAAFYDLTVLTMKANGVEVTIPRPEQAKVKSPWVEHDLIRQGQDLEPTLGEDTDEHKQAHMAFMRSEEFRAWPPDAQQRLVAHFDKTQILEQTLKSSNLNQSGIYEGPGPIGGQGAPPITANRNPTQTFNTMKVGESSKSASKNLTNGMNGGNNAPKPGY